VDDEQIRQSHIIYFKLCGCHPISGKVKLGIPMLYTDYSCQVLADT